ERVSLSAFGGLPIIAALNQTITATARVPLLLVSLTIGPSAAEEEKEKAAAPGGGINAAQEALRGGDYAAAVEGFKKIAEDQGQGDQRITARRGWAEALEATGKYDE